MSPGLTAPFVLLVAFVLLASAPGGVAAEGTRYRVQFLDLPPFEVGDSETQNPLPPPEGGPLTGLQAPDLARTAPEAPPIEPTDSLEIPSAATGEAAEVDDVTGRSDVARVADDDPLPPGEPPTDFVTYLKDIYGREDRFEIEDIWRIARDEPEGLEERIRWGNAAVRWSAQNIDKVPRASTDNIPGADELGLVTAENGLSVRTSAWGPSAGGGIPSGAILRVIRRDGVWLEVEGGGQRGWVAGLWVRKQS